MNILIFIYFIFFFHMNFSLHLPSSILILHFLFTFHTHTLLSLYSLHFCLFCFVSFLSITYPSHYFQLFLQFCMSLHTIFQHLLLWLFNCTLWLATDPEERLSIALEILTKEREVAKLQRDIAKQVEEKMAKSQREYFLREQLKSIKKVRLICQEIYVVIIEYLFNSLCVGETFRINNLLSNE